MSKQIDITQFSFQVFQSKAGNWGARLSNNGFAVCGFLNVATGDALFATHPILGNAWAVAKRDIIRLGGGQFGKEATHSTRVETVTEVAAVSEVKRGPGRPRRVKASEVEAQQAQPAPAPAQGMDPQVKAAFQAMDAKFAALTELLMRKSA